MFVGTADDLGDMADAEWARDTINSAGSALVSYKEVNAGHSTFLVGNDMSYFNDVMKLLQ